MTQRSRWLAGLAAVVLALVMTATAFGYAGEVAAAITVARLGGPVKCGAALVVTATVVDAAGKPIAGQPVEWSFTSTPSTSDRIKRSPTNTNGQGVAKTSVVLACVPGNRHLRATADGVNGGAVLSLTSAGLPNTSTLPGETPPPSDLPVVGTLLAILAIAAACGLTLRRIALSRA